MNSPLVPANIQALSSPREPAIVIATMIPVIQERLYFSKKREKARMSPETKLISSFGITIAIANDPSTKMARVDTAPMKTALG
ncbi:Uncharacterised protein [Chlamydia trachomatis]|nr:Uncharacterised protein [Chlamydia trachomatis]